MWLFRFASAWICFGNVVGCAFVLATAALYAYVFSEPLVSFMVTALEANILRFFPSTIRICYVVVAGHAILAVRTTRNFAWQWFRAKRRIAIQPSRRPTITADKRGPASSSILLARQPSTTTADTIQINPIVFRIRARIRAHISRLWEPWTRYGPEITRLFMIWEVANQTYQANKISKLVASVWINRLVSLVIVMNCWFSPVLHYLMSGRRKLHVRLARLLVDSCLDFVYSIGIPLVIFYPYFRDFSDNVSVFPPLLYYTDTWYVNAISELRQVFVTSWVDLVSKTTGSLALLHRLYVVENVLRDAQDPRVDSRRETTTRQQSQSAAAAATRRITQRWRSRLTKFLDVVLLLWGLVVLSLHAHSTFVAMRGDQIGCFLEMRPWGASSYSCGVLEISCVERQTTGKFPAIVDALDNVDPSMLQVLILSHCEQLEVPPMLQQYSALSMIKVYNSTITAWDAPAALRDATHPSLQVLYFARVNMSEIPAGLLAIDFPARVWDVEFCITNITTFPTAIVPAWKDVAYIVVEANGLAEVPDAILRLPTMAYLQLGMNQIPSLPPWAFADHEFVNIYLDGNPLEELPPTIKTLRLLRKLSVRQTNISRLPSSWLTAEAPFMGRRIMVEAEGSPLCKDGDRDIGPFRISCHSEDAPLITYPIAEEDAWRAAGAATATSYPSSCT